MQVTLTSDNDINARNPTTASERETITAKAGNGVIIEKNGYNEAADDYGLEIL